MATGGFAALLRVNGVEVMHRSAIVALYNVSPTVQRGEVYALLGANDTGKSGMLKAISDLLVPERG